ncbi:hypothetical protein SAMN04488131_113102 [Flavobacterium xueshanense]|uniref:Transposase DDE domain-containing protein n=1 Tax=Flavobacterium xueshanense TaxID=935223 RepID=A0A1I2HFE6_9FLAO|nr:hypothetical protein SAMN04488131_113102 [Flavobacterium xueshanense]
MCFTLFLSIRDLTRKISFYRNLNFGYRLDTNQADRAGQKLLFGVNRKLFKKCTKNAKGRLIERSLHVDLIYQNKVRIENNYEVYRRRQAIVKHPYGVIKLQWDFYYIMTKKTIKHASADVGLIFTAYNLRRIFNLIDQNLLKQYLKVLALYFGVLTLVFNAFYGLFYFKDEEYYFP